MERDAKLKGRKYNILGTERNLKRQNIIHGVCAGVVWNERMRLGAEDKTEVDREIHTFVGSFIPSFGPILFKDITLIVVGWAPTCSPTRIKCTEVLCTTRRNYPGRDGRNWKALANIEKRIVMCGWVVHSLVIVIKGTRREKNNVDVDDDGDATAAMVPRK